MPPRKVRRTNEPEPSIIHNLSSFVNLNVENDFNELQGKTFIQERGFDSSMIICKEIWPLVRYHRWEHFWTIPKDFTVVLIVQKFYTSLRDHESRNTDDHIRDIVSMRGIKVKVTPRIICDFYNAQFYDQDFIDETDLEYFRDINMDKIINYLTEGREEWKYRLGTSISTSFNQAIMFPKAKMWIQFMCTRIVPTLIVFNYTPDMFGATPFDKEKGEHESEEEGERDGSDEMNDKEDDKEDD
ncbi:hypothetical protein Godav_011911 [Gossypium davidsonii]|uniref:Putative plant transposon protein domain-containing protein n=1 Tax=Gossypium davidsonii TaxID=34287 RepID=A0A7J8RCF0_GOSDV|nr:hypothetical protein [Gossypium davidsonii]